MINRLKEKSWQEIIYMYAYTRFNAYRRRKEISGIGLQARRSGTSTTISTYFFSGEVGIETEGCLASLLGQAPALLLLVCLVFSLCIPPSPRVSRGGIQRYRRTETEAVKAAARPAAASVSLHRARDLVLPRASSISGVASPPPLHSPSRWPLLAPSVESGGLRESLETTWCLADQPLRFVDSRYSPAAFKHAVQVCDTICPKDSDGGVGSWEKWFGGRDISGVEMEIVSVK